MVDLSIIIPHRGNCIGLWLTVHSCIDDLEKSGLDYEFVIYTNGDKLDQDIKQLVGSLKAMGRLRDHTHSDEPVSPPVARQRASELATGRVLFFFDNHCMVKKDYFRRIMADMEIDGIDCVHSSVIFYSGDKIYYDYRLTLEANFWAAYRNLPKVAHKAYPTACSGHGGFAVKSSVWKEVGGYGPEGVLVGYGGEEVMFNLKMWLYGKQTHIDPKALHYHYPGSRGYSGKFSDDFYTNMMASANVIGGNDWMYKVYSSFIGPHNLRQSPKGTMFDLLQVAESRSREYAKELASKRVMTLEELLVYFRSNDISN